MGDQTSIGRDLGLVTLAYVVALAAAVAAGLWLHGQGLDLIWVVAGADAAATVVVFAFSVAFDNSSFYDPYWSVAPPIIGGVVWWSQGAGEPVRAGLVMAVVGLWGLRLTYNWVRQWSGLSHEDWRYVDIRERHGRAYWVVSFLGIHFMPTVLVFIGCLSLFFAIPSSASLGPLDAAGAAVGAFAVWLEATADRQLHEFRARKPAPEEILDTGVWGWCRNPNYLGELLIWFSLALLATGAGGPWWVWAGPAVMVGLFLGISIPLKETRMRERRPAFEAHCKRVPILLPLGAFRSGS